MKILQICPTPAWSSRERRVLADAIFLKASGHDPVVYCLKDSFLDLRVKLEGIDRTHPSQKAITKKKFKYLLRDIKNIFNLNDYSVVHCYDINNLWSISFYLRNKQKIPLFLSLYQNIENYHISFYKKWLLNRLDSIFIPSSVMSNNVLSHLAIKEKKIESIGAGIYADLKDHRDIKDVVHFGICLNGDEENANELISILKGIKLFGDKYKNDFKIYLYSTRNWREHIIYRELNFAFEEYDLAEEIVLIDNFNLNSDYSKTDIFISTSTSEVLNDWTLKAMMEGVPTLAPRTAIYQELRRAFGDVLETYKQGDRRDMSKRLYEMVENYQYLSNQLKSKHDNLIKELGPSTYEQIFNEVYSRMITKRERFLRHKKSR